MPRKPDRVFAPEMRITRTHRETPLHAALAAGAAGGGGSGGGGEVVRMLLEARADPELPDQVAVTKNKITRENWPTLIE